MLRAVGFSFIVVGAIDLLARNAGGDAVVGSLSESSTADTAVLHAWEIGTSLLKDTAESLIVYGDRDGLRGLAGRTDRRSRPPSATR